MRTDGCLIEIAEVTGSHHSKATVYEWKGRKKKKTKKQLEYFELDALTLPIVHNLIDFWGCTMVHWY